MHIKIILHPLQGGALWFQNLTEFPHGVSGPIFPLLIAGLHYINIQVYDSHLFALMIIIWSWFLWRKEKLW